MRSPAPLALAALLALRPVAASPAPASSSSAPVVTISTAVASASLPAASPVPSQVALPPNQSWCPSEIFCAGALLQTVNLAQIFTDPKTIVDKPTSQSSQQVLSAFAALPNPPTEGAVVSFEDANFRGEGLELEALALPDFTDSPAFLDNVSDPLVRAWAQVVHGYWAQLARSTNTSALCPEGTEAGSCESSLIPLNHTYVVPGGRFREQYYWDSFWIVEGLIKSELYEVANATLQNFMDELDLFGFIPNGGRIYYLNRSQPPVFTLMLDAYISASGDTAILDRAIPLAEKELAWWAAHRTLNVTSGYTQTTHAMAHYSVTNSAPRPESYFQDYTTANDPTLPALNASQRADLFAELASGAETGWDYSSRWLAQPLLPGNAGLRTLNVRATIPVCLNSILYKAHTLLAGFYDAHGSDGGSDADAHRASAAAFRAGILDLFWDADKLAFYDYNLTASTRNPTFSMATFYPAWVGIVPDEVLSGGPAKAFGMFAVVNMVMSRYNGTLPTTFLTSGQQWDAPNAWPPHQYITLNALRNLPANLTSGPLPTPNATQSTFNLLPANQLGLPESALPAQPLAPGRNASTSGPGADVNALNGTVANGGNASAHGGAGWAATLQRELANRYIASALCSWHATGGAIPGLLPRLSDQELNVTQSQNNTGNMFEKFSNLDIDSAGRGGEYTVQAGFGWTNGVALWIAGEYGAQLVAPACPDLLASAAAVGDGLTTTTGSPTATAGGASKTGAASRQGAGMWMMGAVVAVAVGVLA